MHATLHDVVKALHSRALLPVFQPQVDLRTGVSPNSRPSTIMLRSLSASSIATSASSAPISASPTSTTPHPNSSSDVPSLDALSEAFEAFQPTLSKALAGQAISGITVAKPSTISGDPDQLFAISFQPTFDEDEEVIGISIAIMDLG